MGFAYWWLWYGCVSENRDVDPEHGIEDRMAIGSCSVFGPK